MGIWKQSRASISREYLNGVDDVKKEFRLWSNQSDMSRFIRTVRSTPGLRPERVLSPRVLV